MNAGMDTRQATLAQTSAAAHPSTASVSDILAANGAMAGASHVSALAASSAPATQAQRAVLERIARQRQRWASRRVSDDAHVLSTHRAADASRHSQRVPADAPLLTRAVTFARLHPVATLAALGVGVAMGPARVIRWVGFAWPLLRRVLKP